MVAWEIEVSIVSEHVGRIVYGVRIFNVVKKSKKHIRELPGGTWTKRRLEVKMVSTISLTGEII